MKPLLLALLFSALLGESAASETTARSADGDRKDVTVTVYNENLGLVHEVRTIALPVGESTLELEGVPAAMDPTSVSFRAEGARVLEQNFEYDLLSPASLLDKYVGREVELRVAETVQNEPRERIVKARLLANNQGPIYLIDHQIHLGFPGRVVLPEVPSDLRTRPTLTLRLQSDREGPRDAAVTYLTAGMSWHCDYVAVLNPAETRLNILTAWVTIDNQSGATFENAALKLLAGDVQRAEAPAAPAPLYARVAADEEFKEQRAPASQKSFSEYHLYTFQRRTTLKDQASKQLELTTAGDIPVKKILSVERPPHDLWSGWSGPQPDPQKQDVTVTLEFQNDDTSHLGAPLPAGRVRVNKEDADGQWVFIGEDNVDHTPKNEPVRLRLGRSFDVVAERRQTDHQILRREHPQIIESEVQIELTKRKDTDVEVRVVERFPPAAEGKLLQNSHEPVRRSAQVYEFVAGVKAGATEKVVFRAKVGF